MITRLLVANRGEIARRVFATCRRMGIETVAVHSDADAGAPHVAEADRAVRLPEGVPAEAGHEAGPLDRGLRPAAPAGGPAGAYLRGDLIVAAARRAGADAIHPGYGFLAENAGFAAAVTDAGLTWVGPPAGAITAMGDKIAAKALLAAAGVPMLPTWTEPSQITDFPVLVKAAAGGGGRGMRVVRDAAGLAEAVASAGREAAAAFGDGALFIERYVETARHVEVQIFGDSHGTVVALGERECSIQRRHQKVIEETPSPAVGPKLRAALSAAAVAAGRAVGYVGAGTVEFLLTPDGEFFFLEMNTRLQVEHPVTECVTGLDLVRLQLLVAEGAALADVLPAPPAAAEPVPPVGAESVPPVGKAPAAPADEAPVVPGGHAIEVRLCAEDPVHDFRPMTGTLHRFAVPGVAGEFDTLRRAGLRLDSGVLDGSVVGVHYDSMLAKLIAWAPTRAEAARLLADALVRAEIHGVTTNRDLLVRVLRHPAFRSGAVDTGFLGRHPEVFAPLLPPAALRLHCLAAALAGAAARRAAAPVLRSLPSGWRNVPAGAQTVRYDTPGGEVEVGYRFDRTGALAEWWAHDDAGSTGPDSSPPPVVRLVDAAPGRVTLEVDGVQAAFTIHRVGDSAYVTGPDGATTLVELPRFPAPAAELAAGSLVAPLPGVVARVLVKPGEPVGAGELLLTLEAMKLEHPVHAPTAGVVTALPVAPGAQVDAGAVLAVITPAD